MNNRQRKIAPLEAETDNPDLEAVVDEAIAEAGGDARAAVRALLVANAYLEAARNRALDMVSWGYVRGRLIE